MLQWINAFVCVYVPCVFKVLVIYGNSFVYLYDTLAFTIAHQSLLILLCDVLFGSCCFDLASKIIVVL